MEAKQIIDLLEKHDADIDISKLSWGNHPAVRMWMGYTFALKVYYNEVVKEWIRRGYKNNMILYNIRSGKTYRIPNWLGRKDFHDSHKSNLLRKDPEFYGKYNWNVKSDLKYVWR